MNNKKKIGFKESIQITTFIGFVASFLFFMWMYETDDIQYLKYVLTIWCGFWSFLMIFGFSKGSIMAFGAALVRVATDKSLSTEDKLALIMLIIQEWLNIAADLSQEVNIKKKRKIDKID